MTGVWLEDLSWDEAAQRFSQDCVVIIPIGALAKEHGYHLPLKTDAVVVRELAHRIAKILPVVVAPLIGFGYYPAFTNFAGSQHLTANTFIALVRELIEGLIGHGVKHIAIINTGVSTEAPLSLAVREIETKHHIKIGIADLRTLGRKADSVLANQTGGHADERETSILLAIDPSLVRLKRAQPEPASDRAGNVFRLPVTLSSDAAPKSLDYSKSGATGNPTLATAEKGEIILAAITAELIDGLKQLFPRQLKCSL